MMSKWRYLLAQLNRQLWVRAALYCASGIAAALVAALVAPYLPIGDGKWLGSNAVRDLLTIMASSMLAVATFSLQAMVSSYAAASSSTTPRASRLLIEDSFAQRALSTFVGAFLFSIVGLIALSTGIYGDSGRAVLFMVTVVVIAIVVGTLLRWIDHLSRFGRVGPTIDRVEEVTRDAIRTRADAPTLGALPATDIPDDAIEVPSPRIGYVRHIDVGALERIAKQNELTVHVLAPPGRFTDPARPLAAIEGPCNESIADELRRAFTVGDSRSFDQDPRFGLIVLSEIASRALSPAVNDPGTAIDVIGTAERLLHGWIDRARKRAEEAGEKDDPAHPHVRIAAVSAEDLFDDVFAPIARDGAGMIEVGVVLQRALGALASREEPGFTEAAHHHAARALRLAERALPLEEDYARLADDAAEAGSVEPS